MSINRKALSLLLAVFILSGLLAGCGAKKNKASEGKIDEAAWLETSHKIYEANQLDALLSRHSSLKYSFSYPETPQNDNFNWETAECYYQEWPGYNYARYDGDRFYFVSSPDESGAPQLSCGIDHTSGYDPYFELFGLPEDQFLDTEHESLYDSFTEDGLLHILTVYDETGSRRWIENNLSRDSAGETVHMEMVVYRETCEILRNTVTLEKDGKTSSAFGYTVEYDTPEPESSQALRAQFKQPDRTPITITVTSDPGTDRELSTSLTISQESAFELYADDPYVAFDDADATSVSAVYAWDGTSDISFFVFTDPDQALLDRYSSMIAEAMAEYGPAE